MLNDGRNENKTQQRVRSCFVSYPDQFYDSHQSAYVNLLSGF